MNAAPGRDEAAQLRRAQRRVFGSLAILVALLSITAWVRWCAPAPPQRPGAIGPAQAPAPVPAAPTN